ncbi:hypothetical protein LCGC14_1713480 [marine sediment metagenome]|uniref:Putative regulatory protein FmdB zinc ribbon domain-containing protein n=1 Tax=marine sediment metagenome TaxID=412755 RepID=A0A0F9I1X5_9ZZZZ
MPFYDFICPSCNRQSEVSRPMEGSGLPCICLCGDKMERDYKAEHSSVRGDFNKPIVSVSMAFNTDDLNEHRRQFPGIELKVDAPSRTAYPVFHNRTEKRKYMKARGWVDRNSFV